MAEKNYQINDIRAHVKRTCSSLEISGCLSIIVSASELTEYSEVLVRS